MSLADVAARTSPWTCPFCLLLCDGAACAGARRGLSRFTEAPSSAQPRVDGRAATLDEAVAAAVALLAASRQPLIGGLGTDVAGGRALYRLASACGAIVDGGEPLAQGLRALQDRGQFTTTLAEVRTRADLIVCLQGLPLAQAPEFFDRVGVGDAEQALAPRRHLVMLGPGDAAEQAVLAELGQRSGVTVEAVAIGDPFDTLARLGALVAGRLPAEADPPLARLAQQLKAARYAVIVGEPARLPGHGALLMEAVNRIVGELNRSTRAAALWLGGGGGVGTVNQVFGWLSGLPLRSRAGPQGLEHEPLCFAGERLLAEGAVDCLLWVSSFEPANEPPETELPLIVLGHPDLAGRGRVSIPVSTPGVGSRGHLFRADGVVLLPLFPLYEDTLPTLAEALQRITEGLAP
ncbi:formylmethanofuran dehydrogenase [Pelomonas sp. KK5]|uniref:formylmethanofuran dehydrogenase n=1 Tax=Pelomonas sp. KK5 TaxID=1855730 RepID=UPI00097CA9E2|nr:formylmethanofuran dehydrogenase [Pelomonas sp. KK5]